MPKNDSQRQKPGAFCCIHGTTLRRAQGRLKSCPPKDRKFSRNHPWSTSWVHALRLCSE